MILVDTNVLIELLRGSTAARDWWRARLEDGQRLALSVLTVTELVGGMRSHERRAVNRLLGTLAVFGVDETTAHRAGELKRVYRRSHQGIGIADYLVAGTAQVNGLELATLNVRHFPMFDGLEAPFEV